LPRVLVFDVDRQREEVDALGGLLVHTVDKTVVLSTS